MPHTDDIGIINGRRGKSLIVGYSPRGFLWIEKHMIGSPPISVDTETVEEIKDLMTKAGLTVKEEG